MNEISSEESPSLVGMVFGCLEVLDDGSDYIQYIAERIACIEAEKEEFIKAVESNKLKRHDAYSYNVHRSELNNEKDFWNSSNWETIPQYEYEPENKELKRRGSYRIEDFNEVISCFEQKKKEKHYKCRCKKCGKTHFYTQETLHNNPQYCFRPEYCSSKYRYSTKAADANYRQRNKYYDNEAVCLVDDREKWNHQKNIVMPGIGNVKMTKENV